MQYPSLRDYQNAIINQNNFNIPFFQGESLEIFLNPRGYPFMFVGGFGAIFKFRDKDQREYAFKVFTRDVPDRGERYQALHDTLQKAQLPFTADFHYVPEGLRVKGEFYPAVVMEWGRGIQLDKAIQYDLADDGILQCAPFLAGELFFIVKTLQERGMGHNDLQEGNILVRDDNKLVLIDYDGMFVPSLKNWPPCEMGLPNFQHPLRDKTHFDDKIDDFALISILYQLAVISPDLWEKHHDDRRLLLKKADYENPDQSELIRLGLNAKEAHQRALAELLVQACSLNPLEIQVIEKIEAIAEIMNWLAIPGEPVSEAQAESAIQWALALQTDDVAQYEKNQVSGPDAATAEIKAVKHRKADAGRWKPLREYLEAGKAMRARKAADVRPEKPLQAKTTPTPYARPISSGVKPTPQTPPSPPSPSKSSFGAALATFITLLFKLVWKYVKNSHVRIAVAIMLLVGLPFCMYLFSKPEPAPQKSKRVALYTGKTAMKTSPDDLIIQHGLSKALTTHWVPKSRNKELKQTKIAMEKGRTKRAPQKIESLVSIKIIPSRIMNNKPLLANSLGMEFVYIPPGEFMMGSPEDEPGRRPDERLHKVILTKWFYLQTTEVTQKQWKVIMGANPSRLVDENYPVDRVSWKDVQVFIKKINQIAKDSEYRLPTEAEWEYACRSGTKTTFTFGKCLTTDQANYNGRRPLIGCPKGQYREKIVTVASFQANAWGLYDMHGNVWEWCQDWYAKYPTKTVTDPVKLDNGEMRVLRGGSWINTGRTVRSAYRNSQHPKNPWVIAGFRLVLSQL